MNKPGYLSIGLTLLAIVALGSGAFMPAPSCGEEPSLPAGLGGKAAGGEEGEVIEAAPARFSLPVDLAGFADLRAGVRTGDDPHQEREALGEARLQVDAERIWASGGWKMVGDFVYDWVADDREIDLEEGDGWFDLRQAHVFAAPLDFMDLKAGRQILTWGTGDLLFINDNFPKDWVSFFIGRDVEYLKAPSDAVRLSLFHRMANVDFAYSPRFDSDRYITGERISFYNAALGRRSGKDERIKVSLPDEWFEDDELAWRIYRTLGGYEAALYGYHGYWKSPAGADREGRAVFPPLYVYGASVRGRFAGGIGNLEGGWFDSSDDRDGDDPMIRNGEIRFLAGYERDMSVLLPDFTAGLQYYLEHMLDHGDYLRSLPTGTPPRDENRHVLTVRLTKLMMQQNLELSLFTYWSPSDEDAYLRILAGYKLTDAVLMTAGANLFLGKHAHTFFGQFENNTNVYAGVRYGF